MTAFGYALSGEELPPTDLVRLAQQAEQLEFDFAVASDHYHPWIDRQGNAPFVWSVLGGIAQATERLRIGTGVTCPMIRIHPALIAQAAATAAAMMPGRFFLGAGTGENLNEHVIGAHWPPAAVRREMLEEALEVIRALWQGKRLDHRGRHYVVERARLYTLPDEPPPIYVAASGPKSAELAGRIGDGLFSLSPQSELLETFDAAGGSGKPRYGQIEVCVAEDEAEARRIAYEYWPNTALGGELTQELATPAHFEQATSTVREEDVAEKVVCGSDPDRHLEQIARFRDAGYDHVYFHQIGPDQETFLRFYAEQVLPRARRQAPARAAA